MVTRRALLAMTFAGSILAACGSGGGGGATADESTQQTSTTVQTASVEQVASVVARSRSSVDEAVAAIDPCFTLDGPSCTPIVLGLDYYSASLTAQALAISLDGIDNPVGGDGTSDNPSYQGAIPTEVARLHEVTLDLANRVQEDYTAFSDAGCGSPSPPAECVGLNTAFQLDAGQLVDQLDAWQPYL